MMRRSVAVAVWALVWLLAAPGAETCRAAEEPNVLFIAVDDLNDWISCLGGHPDCRTPNIDRLAKRGVLFTHSYCAAPACNPSRVALLTGIRPSNSGVYTNRDPWRPSMPQVVTLPQHFGRHGYDVYGCGKIFHGRFKDPNSWDEYFARPEDPKPRNRPVNGIPNTAHFDWGPIDEEDEAMADHAVVDWAIDKLNDQPEDEPLFLACGIFRPHLPWYVPEKYFQQHPASDVTLPKVLETDLDDVPKPGRRMARPQGDHRKVTRHDQWNKAVQGYLASIAFADHQVGRLLDALENSPQADNTIIILWGDHGWHLGEKQHWRKFAIWEEATRTPLMMVVPGVTEAGSQCDRVVSLVDIYPTLADVCELPIADQLDGRSLKPLLKDTDTDWNHPVLTTHGLKNHGLRNERWRYIRYANGDEELYDHQQDPLEWKNLAEDPEYVDVKKRLAGHLPAHDASPVERP